MKTCKHLLDKASLVPWGWSNVYEHSDPLWTRRQNFPNAFYTLCTLRERVIRFEFLTVSHGK